MGAMVSLVAEVPTLLLEECDHLLDSVECEHGRMRLCFKPDAYQQAKEVLSMHEELLVITAHYSCNEDGSRRTHQYVYSTLSQSLS